MNVAASEKSTTAWHQRRQSWAWFVVAFGCAVAFAVYTNHAWEDWYITFRSSKNLATGHGLVYNVDERVHTFTSVLGTLIPAALSFVTGATSDDLALWLFRLLNCGVLGLAAALLAKTANTWFSFRSAVVVLLGMLAIDTKTIDFSINGMETAYVILSLSLFFYVVTTFPIEELKFKLGLVWALFEYTRPDGVVYVVLLSAGLLLFRERRRETFKTLVVSGLVGAALFLPWLIFALGYYGTPVPHSIAAKGALMDYRANELGQRFVRLVQAYFRGWPSVLDDVFAPPYSVLFDQPWLIRVGKVLSYLASLAWLLPKVKPTGRIASFAFGGFMVYLAVFTPFVYPWYIPGATLLALIALAFALDAAVKAAANRWTAAPALGWSVAGAVLLFMLTCTAMSAHQFRRMEAINERGNRERIGRWLKANARSAQDTVFVECAGYIGFYSGLRLYDFPGMTSPAMVQARKILNTDDWLSLIKFLAPDWVVLRPGELERMRAQEAEFFQTQYVRAAEFDVGERIRQISFRPYEEYWRMDSNFIVFKRHDS